MCYCFVLFLFKSIEYRLLLGMRPSLEDCQYTGSYTIKENLVSPLSAAMNVSSSLARTVTLFLPPLLSAGTLSSLSLHWSCECCHNPCELMWEKERARKQGSKQERERGYTSISIFISIYLSQKHY